MDNDFIVTLRMKNFNGVKVVEEQDDESGQLIKGIFIPIDKNGFLIDKAGNAYVNLFAKRCTYPNTKGTHILTAIVSKEERDRLVMNGFKSLSKVGTMKPSYK